MFLYRSDLHISAADKLENINKFNTLKLKELK